MVDVDILPVKHTLHRTCWVIMRRNVLCLKNTHFVPPTVLTGWFDCRTSGDLQADTSRCTDKPSMQDCTNKKHKTLKRVVKQLTPFGATHTQRHDTSPLTVHQECVQAVHSTLPVTVSQPEKVNLGGQKYIKTHSDTPFLATQQTLCLLFDVMSSVTDHRLVVGEVIQQRNHCVASFFVFVLM